MIDYKNHKPKKEPRQYWTPAVEGLCFFICMVMLALVYLMLGA